MSLLRQSGLEEGSGWSKEKGGGRGRERGGGEYREEWQEEEREWGERGEGSTALCETTPNEVCPITNGAKLLYVLAGSNKRMRFPHRH